MRAIVASFGLITLALAMPVAAQCQLQKLVPSEHDASDQFGDAVAVSGEWAVVGASRDDEPQSASGAATVYRYDGMAWTEYTQLVPASGDGGTNDLFGWSVDVDAFAAQGPVIVVGAYLEDEPTNAGAAYVYRFSGTAWTQEDKLEASDAANGAELGQAVAISDEWIALGAAREDDTDADDTGAVYVFQRVGLSWIEVAKLRSGDAQAFDRFGISVDVDAYNSSDVLVISGAALHDFGPELQNAGCAYVFRYDGVDWTEQTLVPPTPGDGDKFGESVAIAGDTAVVGAYLDDDGAPNAGAAWIFHYDGAAWSSEFAELIMAQNAQQDDQFGRSVAIAPDGKMVVVGTALDDEVGSAGGATFLFEDVDGLWILSDKLTATDGGPNDEFGSAVAVDGPDVEDGYHILIAASKDDDPVAGINAGSTYVFTSASEECADCNANLIPDGNEIDDDPLLDCDVNGVLDTCEIDEDAMLDCDGDGMLDACAISDDPDLDCDGNGVLDVCEISVDSLAVGGPFYCLEDCDLDCNDNGILDSCDIGSGSSDDIDVNGIPDECEDCNGNGVPDDQDLAEGTSPDCNGNGIPDSCDVDASTVPDCNANGIPDECDVTSQTSVDCNEDGVPDECDDCNGNGIADECDVDPADPDGDGEVALDTNGNGIPDTCEDCDVNGLPDFIDIFLFPEIDCNLNTIIDDCEIAPGTGTPGGPYYCVADCDPDCNVNGVPDSCDIGDGVSDDADVNGVPDECEDCNGNGEPDGLDVGDVSIDCNANGVPDECEIAVDSPAPGGPFYCTEACVADCNENGIPDSCDVADGTSDDCGGNGVPDECEPDCNDNGIADDCDIVNGTLDINENGIPDDCEPDCDDDGVPDFLAILFGQEADCNANEVPDTCDLDPTDPDGNGRVSLDVNGDGIPDECDLGPADLDNDGIVGFSDLLILLAAWGGCPSVPTPCPADFDGSGSVDFSDLLDLLADWT